MNEPLSKRGQKRGSLSETRQNDPYKQAHCLSDDAVITEKRYKEISDPDFDFGSDGENLQTM